MTVEELLTQLAVPFKRHGEHHHTSAGRLQIDCPKCSPGSGRFRLGIHERYGNANCYVCGRLSLYEILAEIAPSSRLRLKALLGTLDRRSAVQSNNQGTPARPLTLPRGIGPLDTIHKRFLMDRGFEWQEIERVWGVRGIGVRGGRLKWRLFIPIVSGGRVVSWTTRAVGGQEPKYLTADPDKDGGVPPKSVLYGADGVRDSVVVVEGPLDVWPLRGGAAAILGLAYSRAQLLHLSMVRVRIVCLDAEPDAQRVARRLCRELSPFPGTTRNVTLSTGKDPSRASPEEIASLKKLVT